jgi:hypothetical protein
MTAYPKRLIEVDLPIKRISAHARREKSIRHGHISTLHIWWARRPLAACRAVICASLWPDPADPICPQSFRDAASQLIADFAEKVFRTTSYHDTISPESFGQWEGIVEAKEQGLAFDTDDPAHLNKLRFFSRPRWPAAPVHDGRLDSVGLRPPRGSESGCAGLLLRPTSSWVSGLLRIDAFTRRRHSVRVA